MSATGGPRSGPCLPTDDLHPVFDRGLSRRRSGRWAVGLVAHPQRPLPHRESVKVSPLTLLLIGLALGGLAFGSCQGARASEATLKLEALLASRDSAAADWKRERGPLETTVRRLRGDSAILAIRQQRTHREAVDSIRTLLATIDDTVARAVAQQATRVVYVELEGCQDLLSNCEQRAANAEQRAHGDSVVLAQTHALLVDVEAAWHTEQQRNRPGFLGLRRFWQAKAWTVPLAAVTTLLLLKK